MSKITEVIVESPTELKLNQDAKKGDYIDLKDLTKVDLSVISDLIKANKDEEYNRLLQSEKTKWDLAKTNELANLKNQSALYEQRLLNEKQALLDNQAQVKKDATLQAQEIYKSQIDNLKQQISDLNLKTITDISSLKEDFANQKANLIEESSKELTVSKDKVRQLETSLNTLTLQKASTGVKLLGEELENWCNNEYQAYAISGFENCTWQKDNSLVANENDLGKGTKADFIFRVYSSINHTPENELTSVCMDMKNENPNSSNKKENSDFYKKLDSDRTKKQCEYALLVSELGMDKVNDSPIVKVNDYPKMYMVRPPYFIPFLSLIQSLGNKYKEALIEQNKEAIAFKDSQDIIDLYNQMRDTYFDKPLEALKKKVSDILSKTETIQKANDSIKETANEIINQTLSTMKEKIDRFDIVKIGKKIDKLI